MAFDLKTWLTDEMKFTADEVKELESRFTPERVATLASGYSRQDDYSRSMNELKKAQDEHAAAVARINNEYIEWGKLKAGDDAALAELRQRMEQSQLREVQLTNRITQLAQATGQDPTKILAGLDVKPEPPKAPAGPDLSKYITTEDAQKQYQSMAAMATRLPAILDDLRDDHRELFGTRLSTQAIIDEMHTRANTAGNQKSLDPRVIWEELHKVPEKRQAVEQARVDKLVADAESRGREAALSEIRVPGSTQVPGKAHGPLFREERTSKLQRPQPESSVLAAAGAFRSGKYRKEGAGQKTGT